MLLRDGARVLSSRDLDAVTLPFALVIPGGEEKTLVALIAARS